MHHSVLLALCLAVACGDGEENITTQASSPPPNPQTPSPGGEGETNQPPDAIPQKGYDPPKLYVNDRGVHFEIFQLDENPYDSKIVTYHDAEKKIVKSEKVYGKGRLNTERKYWPNSKLELEITHDLGGTTTTNRWNEEGVKIEPPPVATTGQTPPTRSVNWTYNYNGGRARLELLNKTSLLLQYLGEPNDKLNNAWIYRNMRISDYRTRRQHSSVQFNISNDVVNSINLLP